MAACDAYMAKPLRYRELYRPIDALLPAREATLVSLRPSGTARRRPRSRSLRPTR